MRADVRWSLVSVLVAAVGLVLAVLPFYVDVPAGVAVAAMVLGAAGLGVGIAGLIRARGISVAGVSGITAGALAVLLAVLAVVVPGSGRADAAETTIDRPVDTAQVLRDELDVSFGTFGYRTSISKATGHRFVSDSQLAVTVRNKLDVPRTFELTVAGFESEHRQVADASETFTLTPGATQSIDFFDLGLSPEVAERLKTAELRAIVAHSAPTETVPADQLDVAFGAPGPHVINGITVGTEVPVMLTNRLDQARTYSVTVVAMDGAVQLATGVVTETVPAHETREVSAVLDKVVLERGAAHPHVTFDVLDSGSYPLREGNGS